MEFPKVGGQIAFVQGRVDIICSTVPLNLMLMLNENGGGLIVFISKKSKHPVFETERLQSCKSRCIHKERPADHWH